MLPNLIYLFILINDFKQRCNIQRLHVELILLIEWDGVKTRFMTFLIFLYNSVDS